MIHTWQWWEALRLWQRGMDTKAIASHFGVHESVIYNGLPQYRERVLIERKSA